VTGATAEARAVAVLASAIAAYRDDLARREGLFYSTAARGRPHLEDADGGIVALRDGDGRLEATVRQTDADRFVVSVDGTQVDAIATPSGITTTAGRWDVEVVSEGDAYLVEVDGVGIRVRRDDAGVVRSPSPAVVSATFVKPGDAVAAGDALAVIEAMKMEMTVTSPVAGVVARVAVDVNGQVDAGAPLFVIGVGEDDAPQAGASPADLSLAGGAEPPVEPSCRAALRDLGRLLLGYDVDPPPPLTAAGCLDRTEHPGHDAEVGDVLLRYADLCSLVRPGRDEEEDLSAEAGSLGGGEAALFTYLRAPEEGVERLPRSFRSALGRVLDTHGVEPDGGDALRTALFRSFRAGQRLEELTPAVTALLDRGLAAEGRPHPSFRGLLDRIVAGTRVRMPAVSDLAREVRFRLFDRPQLDHSRSRIAEDLEEHLDALEADPARADRGERIDALVAATLPLRGPVGRRLAAASPRARPALLEVLARRYHRIRDLGPFESLEMDGHTVLSTAYRHDGRVIRLLVTHATRDEVGGALDAVAEAARHLPAGADVVVDVFASTDRPEERPDALSDELALSLGKTGFERPLHRVAVVVSGPGSADARFFTFRPSPEEDGAYVEERLYRGLHPMIGKRLELWRLSNFDVRRLPSVEDVYLFHATAKDNPNDQRLLALAEVRDLATVTDEAGRVVAVPELERMLSESLEAIRLYQSHQPVRARLHWNRVLLYLRPPIEVPAEEIVSLVGRLAPLTEGLGLQKVVARGSIADPDTGELVERVFHLSNPAGRGLFLRMDLPADAPIRTLSSYEQKVVQMRRRGLVYPYEIVRLLTPPPEGARPDMPSGTFVEHDLDEDGALVPVDRPWGENAANVVVGTITNVTEAYPEGLLRVAVLGDPSHALGSLAEPECRRIMAALDLAERLGVPLEWFAVSAGAKISMESGTENMDWIARVLRRLITFTQAGGEVNVIVVNINVGAQPYWNAEATMLMHTKGVLIMCADGAMVLTGKQALDYSGGVSAEDNLGIGGYDRVMGPNAERAGTVLGPRCPGGLPDPPPPLRQDLRHAGRAVPPPGRDRRPARP
jgi:biotin carboxyl carrier protein